VQLALTLAAVTLPVTRRQKWIPIDEAACRSTIIVARAKLVIQRCVSDHENDQRNHRASHEFRGM
jgi:hypothetical protein